MSRRHPCPACAKEMLLEKVHEGFEVPCPACGHRFAVAPGSTDAPSEPPTRPQGPSWTPSDTGAVPPPTRPGGSGDGTTILVLGILAVTICGLLGPVAWVMGNKERIAARMRGEQPSTQVTVGWALGIAGTILILLSLGIMAVMFSLMAVGSLR